MKKGDGEGVCPLPWKKTVQRARMRTDRLAMAHAERTHLGLNHRDAIHPHLVDDAEYVDRRLIFRILLLLLLVVAVFNVQ